MVEVDAALLQQAAVTIDGYVSEQQRVKNIPGVVVAVGHEREVTLAKGYGHADLERGISMTPLHAFRIASHSKMFTATACMLLLQEGKLRLDDRLARYIDGLPKTVGEATIRQTLNHAAGIIRDGSDSDYWQLDHHFPDAEGVKSLTQLMLPPNDTFKYSNIGYSLAGLVIEKASGMPYKQYVREAIVEPLGLHHTGPDTDDGLAKSLVTGYTGRQFPFDRIPIPDVPTGAMAPATGFYSTAEDLLRFASAHFLGNEELLTDASKREMQQPYWEVAEADSRYGLGFAVIKVGDRKIVGHSGGFPGHTTITWIDPKDHLAIVVLTNEGGGQSGLIAAAILKILDRALKPSPDSAGSKSDTHDIDLDRFTGRFVDLGGVADIIRLGNRLYAIVPSADDPMAAAEELELIDADTLLIKKTSGYGNQNETIRYIRDGAGHVVEVIFGGSSAYPIEEFRERMRDGIHAPA